MQQRANGNAGFHRLNLFIRLFSFSFKCYFELFTNKCRSIDLSLVPSSPTLDFTCLQTMEALPTVLLKPGEADRIIAGHPWIYSSEIQRLAQPPADGDLVQVKDSRQRLLGTGFFNSKSKIHVRMLSTERVEPNEKFFEDRIRGALAIRKRHMPNASSFRIVNAESDFLSGLIVDKYEDVLVIQISALGMDKRKAQIVAALQKIFSPRAILERSDVASRKFEGLTEANGVLWESGGEQAKAWTPTTVNL